MNTFDLRTRPGLPPALAALVKEIPRNTWRGHPNFGSMVKFWMERHMMFRDLMARITRDTQILLDGNTDAQSYGARLSRMGGLFLGELHSHHGVEDHHYFPQLQALDQAVEGAFELLEADHHVMDALLAEFADGANGVLQQLGAPDELRAATERFHTDLTKLSGFLERHLTDEEDIVVPVILKSGFEG